MEILNFLKEYWAMLVFFLGEIGVLYGAVRLVFKAIRCCLSNDILDILREKQIAKKVSSIRDFNP